MKRIKTILIYIVLVAICASICLSSCELNSVYGVSSGGEDTAPTKEESPEGELNSATDNWVAPEIPTWEETEEEEEPKEEEPGTGEEEPEKEEEEDTPIIPIIDKNFSYKYLKGKGDHAICIDKDNDDIFVLRKKQGKDFVVINFADIQIDAGGFDLMKSSTVYRTIKESIETYSPDLITLSGDQAWGGVMTKNGYSALANLLDDFGIPWAVVYGNHDREDAKEEDLANIVINSSYGIFAEGDSMAKGNGNYVINIVEEGTDNIVHMLLMMDSGDYGTYLDSAACYLPAGTPLPQELSTLAVDYNQTTGRLNFGSSTYEAFDDTNLAWYEDKIDDASWKMGSVVESTCIFHIPLQEYMLAYVDWALADADGRAAMEPIGQMRLNDNMVGCSKHQSGMFDKMVELGSTKNVIVGHDHTNDYSLLYNGIRLTYGVKCGSEAYWKSDGSMNGCTALFIDDDGHATIEQHYYNVK